MSKHDYSIKNIFRQSIPYFATLILLVAVVFFGSLNKATSSTSSISMNAMEESNYQVTTDQLSEMYVVASVSDSFSLASTDAVSNNYVIVSVMQKTGQSSADKVAKPTVVDTSSICQGICSHTVTEGETLESIAAKYGLTTDQLRWSNGLKNTDVDVGKILSIPSVPGIVYTVKGGDTADSIASKYGSSAAEIIALNDSLNAGDRVIIPNGTLPETERPEYVAPIYSSRSSSATTYSYTYSGSSSGRDNLNVIGFFYSLPNNDGNRFVAGQCTWYAWWWRKNDPASLGALPSDVYGNANTWSSIYASRGVSRTPRVGAVFQTASGWYGHVGVVTGMNADGSITVREMNLGVTYRVTESTIPANQVGNFNYIY